MIENQRVGGALLVCDAPGNGPTQTKELSPRPEELRRLQVYHGYRQLLVKRAKRPNHGDARERVPSKIRLSFAKSR
jgi:hypothetical protein